MKGLLRFSMIGIWAIMVGSTAASALPVMITWDRILGYDENTLMLEITKDSYFTMSLTTVSLPANQSFSWSAPQEGVYHYRIFQNGSNQAVRYGSFAAVDSGAQTDVVQLDWAVIEDQQRYTMKISAASLATVYLRADGNRFLLRRRPQPVMVEIFPETISSRMVGQATRNQALVIQPFGGNKPRVVTATPAPQETDTAIDDTDYPQWFLYAGGSVQKEVAEAQRVELSRQTSGTYSGMDFGLRGHLFRPLVFQFRGGLHHSAHTVAPAAKTQYSQENFIIDEDRTYADGLLGIDALGFINSPHSLALKAGAAYRELPHLPIEDISALYGSDRMLSHRYLMYGGGIDYTFHSDGARFFLGADSFANVAEHALTRGANMGFGVLMGRNLDLTIEGFYSVTQGEICNTPDALCFVTNTVKVEKSGGLVGLGTSL